MTNEQESVRDWMKAFGQETPEKPGIPSLEVRKLRAKLILEEALETIKALGLATSWRENWHHGSIEPTFDFKVDCEPNLTEILDGCEDLKVVTEGTLIACGLVADFPLKTSAVIPGGDPHFNEVMRSNWSKMWTQEEIEAKYPTVEDTRQCTISHYNTERTKRDIIVKDSSGKVIKSPSYSPPSFKL